MTVEIGQVFSVINEMFVIFADLYILVASGDSLDHTVIDYLEYFLSMVSTMLEEDLFAAQIMANIDMLKRIESLSSKDGSLIASNANICKTM